MIQFSLTKKFFNFFTKKEKLFFFVIIFLQFLCMVLELVSIGSLLPIFKSITDPSWNEKYFGFLNEEHRIIIIFLAVIILFIFKNFFLICSTYITQKIQNKINLRLINDVYSSYLNKRYEFHINNHSSVLLRNLNYVDGVNGLLMRLIGFYSDLILAIMAFFVVLFVDFNITIVAISLMIAVLFSYSLFTKFSIEKYGSSSQSFHSLYMKNMVEGIKSYKEILLSGKQKFFSNRNKEFKEESLQYNLKFSIIEVIPKHLIELIFVFGILASTYYLVINDEIDFYEYLPLIGVIVLGLYKLLPRLLGIFSSYQQFKYMSPIIDIINEAITQMEKDKAYDLKREISKPILFEERIELKDISFSYSNKIILEGLNFLIEKNSCIGIRGESGAGKSTILNILTGLISPTKGSIFIDGKEQNLSTKSWQSKIGFVSQNTHLLDDTIKTNIVFSSDKLLIDEKLMNECIKKSGLDEYIQSLENGLDTTVGENGAKISGGQIQRIGIARAFYKQPQILILDEPTNSLDQENENKIINTLKKLKGNVTMIIVSHREEPLKLSDIKLSIKNGKIIS